MSKKIYFIVLDDFAEWEIAYCSAVLKTFGKENIQIKVVSSDLNPIKSIGGLNLVPDCTLDTIPTEIEALILIGGNSWRKDNYNKLNEIVWNCINENKVVGAICDATSYLAKTQVLNHYKHTGNDVNDLKEVAGVKYTNEANYIFEQAVRDRNVVTANGSAALEFAREICFALQITSEENINEWYTFNKMGYCDLIKTAHHE